ncbi:hypothetical protein Tco_0596325 [Tanacetum coccineum]
MADLAFVNQHNMVAYLEKSDENAEFHQIVDFLSTCSINYALTVSPTIYASYIEQFWNTATSKTVNSVKQIHAIVDGKAVVITESSVRNDLLFDDEDERCEGSGNPSEPQPPPSTAQPTHEEPIPNIESSSPQKTQSPRQALNKDIELPQTSVPIPYVPDEAIHQERLQCNIAKTQSTTKPIEPIS